MLEHQAVTATQKGIVEALERWTVEGASCVKRIDTHMSHLFLGPTHVLKLKRAVRHPFADMSNLEQRQRACEAELDVNRELAPALYESVRSVVRSADGAYTLGGDGETVDFVVLMKRFPDGSLFSDLAERNALTVDLVERAVRALAAFHQKQPPQRDASASQGYAKVIDDLRKTAEQGEPPRALATLARDVFERLAGSLASCQALIEFRRQAGFVRRGHGDFHLGNICLYEGEVTPFDALEFDARLATVDILYDIAFLLMDLRARTLDNFATQAMNAYFDLLGQEERALSLLPFFMALRASVRMAVGFETRSLDEIEGYGRLAMHLLEPATPRLVAIGGLSGSGKSAVSRTIAHRLPGPCGARVLSTDLVRKQEAGVQVSEAMPAAAYAASARGIVYEALARRARAALAAGTSVVADGTYRDGAARARIAAAACSRAFLGIWLQADPGRRADRVATRRDDASDATAAIALAQQDPQDLSAAWQRVDANGSATETTALVTSLMESALLAT